MECGVFNESGMEVGIAVNMNDSVGQGVVN